MIPLPGFITSRIGSTLALCALSAVAAFVGGWTINGWRHGAAEKKTTKAAIEQQRAQYAKRDEIAIAQSAIDGISAKASARASAALVDTRDALQSAVRAQLFTEPFSEETTDAQGNKIQRHSVRRNSAYRVCYNAAATGADADIAACEAAGGHGTVPRGDLLSPNVVRPGE